METKNKLGIKNRRKGHDAERIYAKEFREFGFKDCQTSRYASKYYDDKGVDLVGLPFNVQIKAGAQKNMSIPKTMYEIKERLKEINDDKPLILIHKKQIKQGIKANEYHQMVHMSFKDFLKLLKIISNDSRLL